MLRRNIFLRPPHGALEGQPFYHLFDKTLLFGGWRTGRLFYTEKQGLTIPFTFLFFYAGVDG
jgi:hypothetical protein